MSIKDLNCLRLQVLHATLRRDDSEGEILRTAKVLERIQPSFKLYKAAMAEAGMEVIGRILQSWNACSVAPSFSTIKDLSLCPYSEDAVKFLEEYDGARSSLRLLTHADLPLIECQLIEISESLRLGLVLQDAAMILTSGIENRDKKSLSAKPTLFGVQDSTNFLLERLFRGSFLSGNTEVQGVLHEHAEEPRKEYSETVGLRATNKLFIRTGISIIDEHTGGLRRKNLTGILGFAGQRKSAVLRTMGYHAAMQGHRVLHIPLESDFREEQLVYSLMHTFARDWAIGDLKLKKHDIDGGTLSDEMEQFLFEIALPDFHKSQAARMEVHTKDRTWKAIRAYIERECKKCPVDLVLIDYLTMVTPPNAGHDRNLAVTEMVQDAKQLCLTANDGKGLSMVTPIQGSRKGFEDARNNDGAWDLTGISQYSELDKSLDECLYIFTSPELHEEGDVKIGSCKMRRNRNIPPSFALVHPQSGMILPHERKAPTAISEAKRNPLN